MIQAAPTCSDPARLLLGAPLAAFPTAFVSDPSRPGPLNRFSILTAFPLARLSAESPAGPITLEGSETGIGEGSFSTFAEAVHASLALLGEPESPAAQTWGAEAPFTGGLAGAMDYEFGGHFERMPRRQMDTAVPPVRFGLYASVYIMDHVLNRAWWVTRSGAGAPEGIRGRIADHGRQFRAWLEPALAGETAASPPFRDPSAQDGDTGEIDWRREWQASLSPAAYESAIERIHRYLRDGDIYQANLTVRYRKTWAGDSRALFGHLVRENPAPFAAFLGSPEGSILSSSPELLLNLDRHGRIETRPIKGTVASPDGQGSASRALLASEKDRAEHLMIVDLERNDLGRVSRTGSVRVDPLFAVEKYRGLEHLVSVVRGELAAGLGPCDALGALFPGGSITGAPKIRAMEIIHELEPVGRGIYTGALGWITPEGEARINLAIRTLAQHGRALDLHVGGGIVMDSDPVEEAEECRLKGTAMARAVRRAEEAAAEPTPRA